MALDPRIEVIREKYGLARDDFWELPQKKGTWVAKHAALEVAAAKAGIGFDLPQIIEANTAAGVAVVCVEGHMGDRHEWSTGEASEKNCRNAYPWAMAEKRAKDRVILKLIGIHGLVYSEDEMADSGVEREPVRNGSTLGTGKPPKDPNEPPPLPKKEARPLYEEMQAEIDTAQSVEELTLLWSSAAFKDEREKLSPAWQGELIERAKMRKAELTGTRFEPAENLGAHLDKLEQEAR